MLSCPKRAVAACLAVSLAASGGMAIPPKPESTPKLVVILVVDQMRADYITNFGSQWTKGLRRLVNEGAWFTEAAYPYLNTITCAGHATISTGALPYVHGMILNSWWDRETGKSASCTLDRSISSIGFGQPVHGPGESTGHLRTPTFSEEVRRQLGKENVRVAAFSRKARSAVMLAGPDADVAVWMGDDGNWLTSNPYTAWPFLGAFLRLNPVEKDLRKQWKLTLAKSKYLFKDAAPGEKPGPPQWTGQFPHRLRNGSFKPDSAFYQAWTRSPFSDEYLAYMARNSAWALDLGRGKGTDVLAISFSALDAVGHEFGPRSYEVQDTLIRLDATIGGLLAFLDKRVGKGKYVVALSADHGVADVPEQMEDEGRDAGRVPTGLIAEAVMKVLVEHLGPGRHIAAAMYTDFYFSEGVYEKLRANPAVLEEVIRAIQSVPGVDRVFRGDLLPTRRESADPIERAAALSYFPERSGDLIIVPKRNWFFVPGRSGNSPATHGTAYPYDTRVPLVLWGAGVRPGKYSQPASPADIAPTLAFLLGITMPKATGRVLHEALAVLPEKNQLALPDSLLDSPQ